MTSKGESVMISSPSETIVVTATGSQQGASAKGRRYKQRPLGPAPFASFEDLSDELDSPPETARIPLPGIKEDPASQIQSPSTPDVLAMSTSLTEKEDQSLREALTSSLDAPAPPRIDISRASSSSQHEDSVTSSPEREGGSQTLGYKEDGAIDLRSSTEELDYIQEPGTVEESEAKRKREKRMKKQQQLKQDFCETQSEIDFRDRKSSTCSVISKTGLLCISGRTSRISSVGSIASEVSIASGASRLSTGSQISGKSTRSPSPHRMLLETSFCGSQPVHTQTIAVEAAPALVSYMEKQASRPPSRFCSRSPSPHSIIVETSFCGSKQILPPETKSEITADQTKKKGRDLSPKLGESLTKKADKPEPKHVPEITEEKLKPKKTEAKKKEIKDEVKETISMPRKAKPVSLPKVPDKVVSSKPKKIISLRDIPGDEIYIPLKGPEVDFEDLVRKASPNVKRKVEKVEKSSQDVIFIPLHSPEESEKEKEKETKKETAGTSGFKQNFDDDVHIPLHSPLKRTEAAAKKTNQQYSSSKITDSARSKVPLAEKSRPNVKSEDIRKTKYEVCEDGSIIIPLHSPDEESRPNRTFEEQIRRVDEELQKARELAEKRLREEDTQNKPGKLDLSEYGNRQSLPPTRPDITPVGSRTPSPGSTLSRKSSFASIFRRGDVSGSPDSSGGSVVSRKSSTLSSILKEAGEGLRDRSRSRSKNRDRQSPSPMVRSPSIKKNVFTNLFGKKKGDEKGSYSKTDDKTSNDTDQQVSYATEMGKRRFSADEGDYIIIPLRDPSDPLPEPEQEVQAESVAVQEGKPTSPIVVLETFDFSKSSSQIRSKEVSAEDMKKVEGMTSSTRWPDDEEKKSPSEKISTVGTQYKTAEFTQETEHVKPISRETTESKTKYQEKSAFSDGADILERKIDENIRKIGISDKAPRPKSEEVKKERGSEEHDIKSTEAGSKEMDIDLQHDSSLDMEEAPVKEEMMAVTTGGVRKLKLPPEPGDLVDDHERKGLVLQESFEDELPYVPTTLPLERSVGVPIIPVKQRVTDIKTCPIDRPRSTTPINPLSLEEYVNVKERVRVSADEKMKISLPREDSISGKAKSPRRLSAKGKSWFEFAEEVSQSPKETRKSSLTTSPSPPPLPPKSSPPVVLSTSAPQATTSWINFEEIPEKRKQPKRITTVPPLRSSADGHDKPSASHSGSVVYSYVSPEDCQCECHDHKAHASGSRSKESKSKSKSKSKSSRGIKGQLKKELDSNSEIMKHSRFKNKSIETQGDIEISVKNECKDCECGRHEDVEDDIEKKPLLECNSDADNDDSPSKKEGEFVLTVPRTGREVDGQSLLSDSSFECPSHGAGNGLEVEGDRADMKPFEVDFDIKSNRSSIVSQDEQLSSEEASSSLPL